MDLRSDPEQADDRQSPVEQGAKQSGIKRISRFLLYGVIAASFAVWVYAYSGLARRPPPDELDSTRALLDARSDNVDEPGEAGGALVYGLRAEAFCAPAIAILPDARDAANGIERSKQILDSNVGLQDLVDQLRELPVDTARDDTLRNRWLDDWQIYVNDRAFYANAVAEDEDVLFTLTDLGGGERLERRITRFATTNLMPSCSTPRDVG